jgi:hypothetical protein
LTLLIHLVLVFPTLYLHLILSLPLERQHLKDSDTLGYWEAVFKVFVALFEAIYHGLAPTLASANQSECEFKGLKCPSGHGVVDLYASEAINSIETSIESATSEYDA